MIAYLILLPGIALFLWGGVLFERTFIATQTQVVIILTGAIIGITFLYFMWRQKEYGLLAAVFLGFFLGGSIPYCFIATTNYYFRTDNSEDVRFTILESGNRSQRRSQCRMPYATIQYNGIKKEILFPCDYEKTIANYKTLTLTVSNGFLGYMVFGERRLND
ncbi:MAG: hypothetical protein V4722_05030 [Bacteroidota bacterium]